LRNALACLFHDAKNKSYKTNPDNNQSDNLIDDFEFSHVELVFKLTHQKG